MMNRNSQFANIFITYMRDVCGGRGGLLGLFQNQSANENCIS